MLQVYIVGLFNPSTTLKTGSGWERPLEVLTVDEDVITRVDSGGLNFDKEFALIGNWHRFRGEVGQIAVFIQY